MSPTRAIIELLGGDEVLPRSARSLDDLAKLVREGLPYAGLEKVMTAFELERRHVLQILGVSERNLARRRKQSRLSADESDRLYRLVRVLAHALSVFESTQAVADWLRSPNVGLSKQEPISVLDTDIGVEQVGQILGRIEHGIPG